MAATSIPSRGLATEIQSSDPGICCFLLKYGVCDPPRPPCRFRHDVEVDDGVTPCCFGATCRHGHAKRFVALRHATPSEKLDYWHKYNDHGGTVGISPAVRDATLLRSQLEPWGTADLRQRLAESFGEDRAALDPLGRAEIMHRLLQQYEKGRPRTVIRVDGTKIRQDLLDEMWIELEEWRSRHGPVNTRPSIQAKSYMILRSPMEFELKQSNNANGAAKKLSQNQRLWNLAKTAMDEVDPDYSQNFSALAVTYGFTGSPHIDKQNTGPFYGLSLGDFSEEQGGVCVEVDAFTVAHVRTKNRLGKVDGRFPHWVAPYDVGKDRYSLIYYSTWQKWDPPKQAYFGPVVED
jgi:hypothetical protein